eukprot:scaffold11414_cov21-Phaeocystis_antarctica.AAC.1
MQGQAQMVPRRGPGRDEARVGDQGTGRGCLCVHHRHVVGLHGVGGRRGRRGAGQVAGRDAVAVRLSRARARAADGQPPSLYGSVDELQKMGSVGKSSRRWEACELT